jgi:hypothetical protein
LHLAILTHHRPTDSEDELGRLARDLARLGHRVTLLGPAPARSPERVARLRGLAAAALDAALPSSRRASAPVVDDGVERLEVPLAPGKRMETALAALLGASAARHRPDLAVVAATRQTSAIPATLAALRVPYVLYVSDALEAPSTARDEEPEQGPAAAARAAAALFKDEAQRRALRLAARGARAVLVEDAALAEPIAAKLDVEEVSVLPTALSLDALPLFERARTRAALGLSDHLTFLGLATPLAPEVRLDLAALAHRHLAGVGLLVAGHGEQDTMIGAMAAATRPSSPVLHLGPHTPTLSVAVHLASEVCLSLRHDRLGEDALEILALGRRLVALDVPGVEDLEALYPGLEAVHLAAPTPDDLMRAIADALEAEERLGPLPEAAVHYARRHLGPERRASALAELLQALA